MIDLIPQYYTMLDPAKARAEISCGQIVWAPCLLTRSSLDVLTAISVSEFAEATTFRMGPPKDDSFNHQPLTKPELRKDEALAVVRCKRRPAVVISCCPDTWNFPRHRSEDCRLLAPLYSADRFEPEFVERVKAYEYNSHFYLPESQEHHLRESLVRLDLIQPVGRPLLEPRQVAVFGDAFDCLGLWLHYYLTGELETFLAEYRADAVARLG